MLGGEPGVGPKGTQQQQGHQLAREQDQQQQRTQKKLEQQEEEQQEEQESQIPVATPWQHQQQLRGAGCSQQGTLLSRLMQTGPMVEVLRLDLRLSCRNSNKEGQPMTVPVLRGMKQRLRGVLGWRIYMLEAVRAERGYLIKS
jgi:hypothetical protein